MKVMHIITDLGNGGAQSVLFSLVTNSPAHDHIVVSMVGDGKYHQSLIDNGFTSISLGMKRGSFRSMAFFDLIKVIKHHKPDIIQTWMYHANVFGGLAARCAGHRNVVWGIHSTKLDANTTSTTTKLVVKASSLVSKFIPRISICCSKSAIRDHRQLNYPEDTMVFVANGYDINRFKEATDPGSEPCSDEPRTEFVTLARWDPQKDHLNLIKACSVLVNQGFHDFHCTMAGSKINSENTELVEYLEKYKVQQYFTLLGPISTVPELLKSSDYLVLPSAYGEAFPNVIAEAMLSGTPCVVTDVGDAAEMVGSTGWVVEPRNPEILAAKMLEAHTVRNNNKLPSLSLKCRARGEQEFSIEKMVIGYEAVWSKVFSKSST